MIVTDKKYHIETKLVEKLDLMIDRMSDKQKKDNLLLVEGAEGDGKTNGSVAVAYYIAHKTGRKFSEENMFFDAEKMVQLAQSTERQILIWDEPALSGLTTEWWKKAQINLVKLLMIARKKRHFFIFNFTKFYKFNEYIVVDRAIGMIHVYARYRKDGTVEQGRFTFHKKSSLEQLYYYYRSTKRRAYKKFNNFYGHFPWVLPKLINEDKYEQMKDEAILGLGQDDVSKKSLELYWLKYKIASFLTKNRKYIEKFSIPRETLYTWRERYKEKAEKYEKGLENGG